MAPGLSRERLTELLQTDPMGLGYAAVGWTAPLLSAHVHRCDAADALCVRTMRGRLHAAGLAWKRPGRSPVKPQPVAHSMTAGSRGSYGVLTYGPSGAASRSRKPRSCCGRIGVESGLDQRPAETSRAMAPNEPSSRGEKTR